jgi:Uri superfamily endonuclease
VNGSKTEWRTYQLVLCLRETVRIQIGALGMFDFPAGYYLYTGSAKKNLEARVRRHLRRNKKLRWHIDYLLNPPEVQIVTVFYYAAPECVVNQKSAGSILIPRFGASDCQNRCGSHLKFCGNQTPEKIGV